MTYWFLGQNGQYDGQRPANQAMSNERTQLQQKDHHQPKLGDKISAQAKTSSPAASYLPPKRLSISRAASDDDIPLTSDNLLFLQRTVGNRAVAQLLQRKGKLSQPGDAYEREADRVADHVLRMPVPSSSQSEPYSAQANGVQIQRVTLPQNAELRRQPLSEEEKRKRPEEETVVQMKPVDGLGTVQRQTMPEDEEKRKRQEEEFVQAKEQSEGASEITPQAESQINDLLSSGGEPLSESARNYFEPRFGQDFSDVRVHHGGQATESAQAINARAYTAGRDVVFGSGEYAPDTSEGKRLLAHELTHVVQQDSSSLVQRKPENNSQVDFEFFNLSGVITSKNNMQRRLDNLFEYQAIALRVGDTVRRKLLAYSDTYRQAYADYAQAIRSARQEAQDQNMVLSIVIGVAMNVTAAFILPSTAAGWFALTAAEAATALVSGAAQATVGAGLSNLLQFSGGDLEPAGLSPAAQELEIWRQVSSLYRAAARQSQTVQNLTRVVTGSEYLVGEIRVQAGGGLPTMTEDQALDRVEALILADQSMARTDDGPLTQSLSNLREFEAQINALNPESYPQQRMEQDIWILWMSGLTDTSVLDLDAIEDRLHAIHVLGPGSRLGVDFGIYTFWFEEDEARDAARGEASRIRQQRREMQPRSSEE